jgi:nucleotide-binding universal stress UspA family protein
MKKMILCPTRGGKASYPNQDCAIHLAKERGADLLFLYVTNIQFLGLTALPKVVNIEAELEEMGDFLLAMAQERAQKAGVKALTTVRSGVFRTVLKEVLQEYPIETIVIGTSSQSTGVVTPDFVRELAEEVTRESGVEFIVLYEGKIVDTHQSQAESKQAE